MPEVKSPVLLKAAYDATMKMGPPPATLFDPSSTVFRAFSIEHFTLDTHRHIFRRDHAEGALCVPAYGNDQNRWTGQSLHSWIPDCGGLYCSVQQQATVNEAAYYLQKNRAAKAMAAGLPAPAQLPRSAVLHGKCVLKIRLLGRWMAADLSVRHNPGALEFLNQIGGDAAVKNAIRSARCRSTTVPDIISDSDDCSLARGIGLALAQKGYEALQVETARDSERSPLERGDNLVFFGRVGQRIRNLSAEEAYLFPVTGPPERYPVQF